jgi:hypothetical protein
LIHYPCTVDDVYYENTRIAHRALFLNDNRISYFKLQRALKRGKSVLLGHRIERVTPRLAVGLPLRPDDDGADLIRRHLAPPESPEYRRGQPLLRYPPGESPIERGLPGGWY